MPKQTRKHTAVRPATAKQPAVRPPTAKQARATTSRQHTVGGHATTRPRKNMGGLLIGAGVGGGALVIILVAVAVSGDGAPPASSGPARTEKAPVDVSGMVAAGEKKCEEGYALIQSCQGQMESTSLGPSEKAELKGKLERGVKLIDEGMHLLEKARAKAGENVGNPRREWGMARKMANNFIANLGK